MRRGQRRADRPENQRQPQGNKAAVQVCCRSASRRVSTRDGSGVPVPQRFAMRDCAATVAPPSVRSDTQRLSLAFGFLSQPRSPAWACKTDHFSQNRDILAAGATLT
jgi:hypothetical protein